MTDALDPDTHPRDLRIDWAKRPAATLARFAGVACQRRLDSVRWLGPCKTRIVVWRKRSCLYVVVGRGDADELMRRPGAPLVTWGQLEGLVAGLVPRAPEFSDGEADACTRIMGGGL